MSCHLCSLPLPKNPINEETFSFCCNGCRVVFQILKTKGELENYQTHPLFQEALQAGMISGAEPLQAKEIPDKEIEKIHLVIQEMWCPSCAEAIQWILLREKGIFRCAVDYVTDLAIVEYAPRLLSKEKMLGIIKKLGYRPSLLMAEEKQKSISPLMFRFAIAAFCAGNLMMFSYPLYVAYFGGETEGYEKFLGWSSLGISLPVVTYSASPLWRRFFTSFKVKKWGMETLVVVGVMTAFFFSLGELLFGNPAHIYFDSMSMVLVFLLLGKIIESKAKFSAKETLTRLSQFYPKKGRRRLEDGNFAYVPIKELKAGDYLQACMGEKIVLDGKVISGQGTCEEALLTGEALPVKKKEGSFLIGGSIVKEGSFLYEVKAVLKETFFSKILESVEESIEKKETTFRPVDTVVRFFVPSALFFALAGALFAFYQTGRWDEAIIRSATMLLIACPCAIGIASPMAEAFLLDGLARMGVIVRNRAVFAQLGKESVFVFDKTGTLTEGHFRVQKGLEDLSQIDRQALKALAARSTHPVANAIDEALSAIPASLHCIEEIAGRGMQSEEYSLGSRSFMKEKGIASPENLSDLTQVYFAKAKKLLAVLELGDRLKEDAKETLNALAPAKCILLSGDAQGPVESVAKACQMAEWEAECTPQRKRERIAQLRREGHCVAMLGDGVNDAPALTEAHVAISVMRATDLSKQVSDLFFTTDQLSLLPKVRTYVIRGRKIIRQNFFWAFIYNIVGIGFAFFGLLSPFFAAIAMILSSLCVTFNALRLKNR